MASGAVPPTTAQPTPPTFLDALSATQSIFRFLEQHQYFLLPLLPFIGGWNGWFGWGAGSMSQYPPELWSVVALLTSLTVVGFISSTRNSSGPIRWAYLEGNQWMQSLSQHLPGWSMNGIVISLIFFPMLRIWSIAVLPVAWQYILFRYREGARNITKKAEEYCYRAALAAQSASKHMEEANEFEKQALAIASTARRDSRLMDSLKAIDFFDVAATSWSSLGQITQPLESARQAAKKMVEEAEACQDADLNEDDNGSSTADMLTVAAQSALNISEQIVNHAREAQAQVQRSQDATKLYLKGRSDEVLNAQNVTKNVRDLVTLVHSMPADAAVVAHGYEKVKWIADQAKLFAEGGDFAAASAQVADAGKEARKTVDAEARLLSAKQRVREALWKTHLG
ncbi:hypothetical protein M501DRAFT_1035529 [Patellaria atrata CBS 101060]|uniref:Uncharacterized protein n=1 Tax=Patellaria atrata CBS 101060 TaxID=1346257 RepID=A0A9P4VM00_9PEZI|nr:hypothetical protein M501DRAFT_1035529 [Patellaria atrata CBS 101060]